MFGTGAAGGVGHGDLRRASASASTSALHAAAKDATGARRQRRASASSSARRRCSISPSRSDACPGGWRRSTPPPIVSWSDDQIAVTPIAFVAGSDGRARSAIAGTWRQRRQRRAARDGDRTSSSTRCRRPSSGPTRYGGVVDLDATIRGTRERPRGVGHADDRQRPRRARQLPEAAGAVRLRRPDVRRRRAARPGARASGSPQPARCRSA